MKKRAENEERQNPREPETEEKKKGVKETNSLVFTPLFSCDKDKKIVGGWERRQESNDRKLEGEGGEERRERKEKREGREKERKGKEKEKRLQRL